MLRKMFLILSLAFSPFWIYSQNLESSLPQETLLYLSIPTGKEWSQQYRHSAFGQFLQENEIQQLGEKIVQHLDFAFQEMNQQLTRFCGNDLSQLWALLDGEIGFALIQMDSDIPEMIATIGFSSVQEGKNVLQTCCRTLGTPEIRANAQGSWEVIAIRGTPLYFGWRGQTVFFTLQENRLKEALFGPPLSAPLTQLPAYQEFSKVFGEKKPFRLWINTQEILKKALVQQALPLESQEIMKLLGVDQWTSFSFALCFDQLDLKWAYQIGTDGSPPRGLNLFLNPRPLSPHILKRLPQSLSAISVFQFDSKAFYQQVRNLILYTNPDSWNTLQGYLDALEQTMQIPIEDALSFWGTTFSSISFEDTLGEQTVYCFYPENPMLWSQKILKMFQNQLDLVKKEYRGKEIYQLRIPLGQIEQGLSNILPTNIIQAIKEVFAFPTAFYVDEDRIVSAHLPQIL
ncbi:MAG: hypothetical protein AABZ60_19425, partial [Planctomycetota bacterium]